jgi:hypothetical protein
MSFSTRFAHHPTCHCYDHHLLRLGPVSLCLGCTCLSIGLIAGALGIRFCDSSYPELINVNPLILFAVTLSLLIPTFVQFRLQRKLFKIISRFLLGFSIVTNSFVGLILVPPAPFALSYSLIYILSFLILATLTLKLRTWFNVSDRSFCNAAECVNRPDSQISSLLAGWNIPAESVLEIECYSDKDAAHVPAANRF